MRTSRSCTSWSSCWKTSRTFIPSVAGPGTTVQAQSEHPVPGCRTRVELAGPRWRSADCMPRRAPSVSRMGTAQLVVLTLVFGLAVGAVFALLLRAARDRGAAAVDLVDQRLPDGIAAV